MSTVVSDTRLQPIRYTYYDGQQAVMDRAAGITIGSTTALSELGTLFYPSAAMFDNARELTFICRGRYAGAVNKRFQVVIDGALTLYDATTGITVSPAQFEIIVKISKILPGNAMFQMALTLEIPETSTGGVGQQIFAAFNLTAGTFDNPGSDFHAVQFNGAKNAVGDTFQSYYSIAYTSG